MRSSADQIRVVIDETSFDFRDLTFSQLDLFLDQFNDALQDLRRDGSAAWKPPMFAETPCLDEHELYNYLLLNADRDVMLRFFSLLDKAVEWDPGYPACDEVQWPGAEPVMALSLSFATTAAVSRHGVACLVFPGSQRRGFLEVASVIGHSELFFFAMAAEIVHFWRRLYELENLAEPAFFELAGRAFPNLIFHPRLTFRRFQGSYRDRRNQVVLHLGGLNDHFLTEYQAASEAGLVSDVEARLAAYGVGGVSMESVRTHRNTKAMHMREVDFNGIKVSCEWHTKLRPEVDRIHFAFGDSFGDKILIGIFVDHLPT